jgi:hypothetical protein
MIFCRLEFASFTHFPLLLFIYVYVRFVLSRNGNSLIEMNDNNAEEAAAGASARS